METALLETIRVRAGVAPLWGLHLRRLLASCRSLGVPFPPAFGVPGGGRDRVHRLEVSRRGASVTEREVGPTVPIRLATVREPHQPYPHKTTDRRQFERASKEAGGAGADDALMLAEGGWVAETTIWTLFWWEAGRPCTPPLTLGVLPGVGRSRIEELTPIEEHRVDRASLAGRPLFVVNAVRGIVEVVALDGVPVPASAATAALAARFWP